MLTLTRRVCETIIVGDKINVTVLGVRGNQVRIGIDAPKDVPVHREEIFNRIKQVIFQQRNAKSHRLLPNHWILRAFFLFLGSQIRGRNKVQFWELKNRRNLFTFQRL